MYFSAWHEWFFKAILGWGWDFRLVFWGILFLVSGGWFALFIFLKRTVLFRLVNWNSKLSLSKEGRTPGTENTAVKWKQPLRSGCTANGWFLVEWGFCSLTASRNRRFAQVLLGFYSGWVTHSTSAISRLRYQPGPELVGHVQTEVMLSGVSSNAYLPGVRVFSNLYTFVANESRAKACCSGGR